MTDDLLANLGRLVSGQTSTRSLNERREELRKSRAQSVERAKNIEDEERMKNPKFDAALKNIERFDADRRAKSLGPDSREKRVTFAPSSSSSESEGKPSKKSIATSLKQFLGFKSVGPVSPVPLASGNGSFHTYRSPDSSSSDRDSSISSPDSFADVSINVSPAVIRPALFHQPVLEREILVHPVNGGR